jgi:hypothetical protein
MTRIVPVCTDLIRGHPLHDKENEKEGCKNILKISKGRSVEKQQISNNKANKNGNSA